MSSDYTTSVPSPYFSDSGGNLGKLNSPCLPKDLDATMTPQFGQLRLSLRLRQQLWLNDPSRMDGNEGTRGSRRRQRGNLHFRLGLCQISHLNI